MNRPRLLQSLTRSFVDVFGKRFSMVSQVKRFHLASVASCNRKPFKFSATEPSKLDPDLRERLENEEKKAGFLPNVFPALSHRQAELRVFLGFYDLIMADREGAKLTIADKELIVTAISAENNCLYCAVAHGALLRVFSKNHLIADQVSVNRNLADLNDRQKAILNFADKVSAMAPVTAQDYQELEAHGLGADDAWDIGAITAFFNMSNRYAHFMELMPNEEFYNIGRGVSEKK